MPIKRTKRLIQPLQVPKSLGPAKPQTSPLATLPVELLSEIILYLDLGTQIALGLTSQYLLRISTSTKLKINPSVGQSVFRHRRNLARMIRQIHRRVVTETGPVEPSARWHFCASCLMLRPTNMAYWRKLEGPDITRYLYHSLRPGMEQILICPECKAEELALGLEGGDEGA